MMWISNHDAEIVWQRIDRLVRNNPGESYVVSAPRGTDQFPVERLEKMNIVGIYLENGECHAL